MTIDQLKEVCKPYYVETEVKIFEDGTKLYRTIHKKHHHKATGAIPLGCFKTELKALQALYENLVARELIKNEAQ